MNSMTIWIGILIISITFGFLERTAFYNPKGQIFKILEIWRHTMGYFIALTIVYFFIAVRWPRITSESVLSVSDFVLGIVFLISIIGWLPHFIRNITEGINAIISRVLK